MAHATYADVERAVDKLAVTALVIRQQRDDLLAALQGLYDACELRANREGGDFGPDIGPAVEIAEAAIANAKA